MQRKLSPIQFNVENVEHNRINITDFELACNNRAIVKFEYITAEGIVAACTYDSESKELTRKYPGDSFRRVGNKAITDQTYRQAWFYIPTRSTIDITDCDLPQCNGLWEIDKPTNLDKRSYVCT